MKRNITNCIDVMSAAQFLNYYNAERPTRQISRITLWRRSKAGLLPGNVYAKLVSTVYVYLIFETPVSQTDRKQ